MLIVVPAVAEPDMVCVDSTSRFPDEAEPIRLLPVEVVLAEVSLMLVTTSSCCEAQTSPAWTWVLETVDWLVAAVVPSIHIVIAAVVPTIRGLAGRGIVGFHVVVGRHEGA